MDGCSALSNIESEIRAFYVRWEVFHRIKARYPLQPAYSGRSLPPIPRESCHRFHGKPATGSTRRLPPIR
jgi:hypothetical protein